MYCENITAKRNTSLILTELIMIHAPPPVVHIHVHEYAQVICSLNTSSHHASGVYS